MTSLFWKNLEDARIKANKERKYIEKECNLANNAFTQGLKRASSPSVDLAYRLAQAVGSTVEELVDGESGVNYVRRVIENDPRAIRVPERISSLVADILLLDDNELRMIRASVEAAAANKNGMESKKKSKDTSQITA